MLIMVIIFNAPNKPMFSLVSNLQPLHLYYNRCVFDNAILVKTVDLHFTWTPTGHQYHTNTFEILVICWCLFITCISMA